MLGNFPCLVEGAKIFYIGTNGNHFFDDSKPQKNDRGVFTKDGDFLNFTLSVRVFFGFR